MNRKRSFLKKTEEQLNDLGFGSRVSEASRQRLLNRDGSFNVVRSGLPFLQSMHLYNSLLTMSWTRFHITIAAVYVLVNGFFASAYLLVGVPIGGSHGATLAERFMEAFFFSVQTFTTVGYGHMVPMGFAGNMLATVDAYIGLMSFALATGLLFARFSRPTAKILFSNQAVVAPYQDISALEFRMANIRKSELVEVEIKVLYAVFENADGHRIRRYFTLELERPKVSFLPLHLTVVHPITEHSPLHRRTREDLIETDAEVLVMINAFDETFSQTVHTRMSYKCDEIIWGARFGDMFRTTVDGSLGVDLGAIHDHNEADLPATNDQLVQN